MCVDREFLVTIVFCHTFGHKIFMHYKIDIDINDA